MSKNVRSLNIKITGMPSLANLVGILRGKNESRQTRLARESDTGFDKKYCFPNLRSKRKEKDKLTSLLYS